MDKGKLIRQATRDYIDNITDRKPYADINNKIITIGYPCDHYIIHNGQLYSETDEDFEYPLIAEADYCELDSDDKSLDKNSANWIENLPMKDKGD